MVLDTVLKMRFLEEVQCSDGEFGIQLVLVLAQGWKDAARKFPTARINEILKPSIDFAQRRLKEREERIELASGEYGLTHIHLIPARAGMDLYPDQNSYISHNLTGGVQLAAILPIMFDYLKLLECVPS